MTAPIQTRRIPMRTLITAVAVVAAVTWIMVGSAARMPATVSIHFAVDGKPDAWMEGPRYLRWMIAALVGVPTLTVAVVWLTWLLPASAIHLPGVAADRIAGCRPAIDRRILVFGIELALAQAVLLTLLHLMVMKATAAGGGIGAAPLLAGAMFVVLALILAARLVRDALRLTATP